MDRSNRALNAAIVGCGWVSDWHANDLAQLPELFKIVACCDVDADRAQSFTARHRIARTTTRYADVLTMADVDVVVLCTPPATHHGLVLDGLAAAKHVVCEKPFVASLAEVDEIQAAEGKSNARVMPIFQYRFGDGIARVRHAIRSGVVGAHYLSTVETAKRRGPDYYAVAWRGKFATELGGVLLTQAIHIHDLLLWLTGPAASVSCFKTTRVNPIEVEDCAVAAVRLADGSLASLSATLGSARQVTRLRLCFENVTFEKQCFDEDSARPGDEPWTVIPKNAEVGAALDKIMAEVTPQKGWFARQYELFYEAVQRGTPFPVTLDDARRSIELITAMFHSDETQAAVSLPIGPGHPKYKGWIPARAAAAH